MASVVTSEFVRSIHTDDPPFSLLEQQSFVSRLIGALKSAVSEFVVDPLGFIRAIFSADIKDSKRQQIIYFGLAGALVLHGVLIAAIALLGLPTVFVKQPPAEPQYQVTILKPSATTLDEPTIENASGSKAEAPKGSNGGGGGGGQLSALPPSKGQLPPMLPGPQVVNMNPSNIPDPILPISPTIVGPLSPPPPPAPIGDPTGKTGEFSGGPGDGGGIGTAKGTGVGRGDGPGLGPGGRGSKGGDEAGSPKGLIPTGPVDFRVAGAMPGFKTWTWIRRQTAVVTPEAQENKVIGTVVLRATFNADGTITDIQIAMPVQHMSESAREALRRSTFRPATVFGVPITVRNVLIRIDVHY